ncbi:sodium:proton antiporter [Pelagibius sp. Alg239-R121]|uniref:cation:proton antiporter n=1 Tax=Pelagibius sp. Alg239-R121 TaxID=2993448 RepID=UPI0024A6520A|nr:sodium:proton antiporter [Pelagibius sp. Alg239-R121]
MALLILTVFTVGFCMIARRLSSTVLTAPMVFIALGILFAETGFLPQADAETSLHLVAEVALILLLFLDAAQTDLSALRARHTWPLRMLIIGLPLSILLGTLAALPLLDGWPIFAVALMAAILAPTDAALGQAVVTNPIVPERVRRALTVESGLNDGLALPVVLLFASLTAQEMGQDDTNWILFGAMQLLLGPLAGVFVGYLGGKLLIAAQTRQWTSEIYEGIAAVALAGMAYLGADVIGGNGFIAAFVAGLSFGNVLKGRCKFVYEFTESDGQIVTWAAFFLLGLALVPEAIAHLTWPVFALILISLFIVRPLAIWLSLLGSDASPTTRIFFGWFGPRGLATALFALLVVQKIDHDFAKPVLFLAVNAVWISALLHGISAVPGAKLFAAKISKLGDCPETEAITVSAKPLITRHHH